VLHEDGKLEILGRLDDARKVRGGWAEPASIAAVLREHRDVARAVVVAGTGSRGQAELSAFVVARDGQPGGLEASLRQWLGERVPTQSVPAHLTVVEDLPLQASGKVNLRRLKEMARATGASSPSTATSRLESSVLATFRDVLEQPDLGADDAFDSLGADSLDTIVLCGELERTTARRVRVSDLRRHPTAHTLAAQLERRARRNRRTEWRLPALDLDASLVSGRKKGALRRVFVTGATGALGRAFVRCLLQETGVEVAALVRARGIEHARERLLESIDPHHAGARLMPVVGDLSLPRFGLSPEAFRNLAADTEAIVHLGADLDIFAEYEELESVNVGGTREALRLAFEAGARLHHLSSSAVLGLDPDTSFDEDDYGFAFAEALAPGLTDSDGYSRSKLAAEALVWLAFDHGLEVSVTRIPHLVGVEGRLADTLRVLLDARVLPEGAWSWQLAPVASVCRHLVSTLEADTLSPLVHLTTRSLRSAEVADALEQQDIGFRTLSLPAVVTVLATTSLTDAREKRGFSALDQLVREHGPRAALSLADAKLASRHLLSDDPITVIAGLIADTRSSSRLGDL
jgi:myxalamid-type nonribosomal peptide synthetase MxaA